MANIKSQIKRNRQNEKRRLRNRNYRGSARAAVKDARLALEVEGGKDSPAAVLAAISSLDKAAQKGAIHSHNAARRKSRLMKRLSALGLQPKEAVAEPAVEEASAKETKSKAGAKKPAEKKVAIKKKAEKK